MLLLECSPPTHSCSCVSNLLACFRRSPSSKIDARRGGDQPLRIGDDTAAVVHADDPIDVLIGSSGLCIYSPLSP